MKNQELSINTLWLADDDRDDRELFEEAIKLTLPHVSLTFFGSGIDLMDTLRSGSIPDILFLDLILPQKDGLDCLKEIRQESGTALLPIVIYTGLLQKDYVAAAYKHGANLYYAKPFNFQHLVKGLELLFQMNWKNPSAITSGYSINNTFLAYDPLS